MTALLDRLKQRCYQGATRKVAEMLEFPRKEERKNERKEGERKEERKVKGYNRAVYWERRRKFVKSNEGTWLATKKKNIFLSPDLKNHPRSHLVL